MYARIYRAVKISAVFPLICKIIGKIVMIRCKFGFVKTKNGKN